MENKPEINEIYRPEQIIKNGWSEFLFNGFWQFIIPTERIIKSVADMTKLPDMGRAYWTRFRLLENGKVLTGLELQRHADTITDREQRNALWRTPQVYMKEVYYDGGDDGHTAMKLGGFKFVAVLNPQDIIFEDEYA